MRDLRRERSHEAGSRDDWKHISRKMRSCKVIWSFPFSFHTINDLPKTAQKLFLRGLLWFVSQKRRSEGIDHSRSLISRKLDIFETIYPCQDAHDLQRMQICRNKKIMTLFKTHSVSLLLPAQASLHQIIMTAANWIIFLLVKGKEYASSRPVCPRMRFLNIWKLMTGGWS